ncbi:hypothetical protein GP2143_05160 [marine gamma proteobacterium HTCC2143]|uniref:Uncharacterized protein n=1 Tax=marine gamma proteobacterium HTCC2143 TaxID=247633 RepID=A0YB82_9GAMM|nr:hypothetical protein GP2143_05160 [marine gamma proteobacterium HTCC2143]
MKTIIVLITALVSFNSFARATDTSDSPSCAVTGVAETNSGLLNILEVSKSISKEQLNILMKKLCIEIDSSAIAGRSIPKFFLRFKEAGVYNGSQSDFTPFLHKFLNENKQQMICPKHYSIPPKHLYKRMFQHTYLEFFEEYIIDPEMKDLNLNAYEVVNGKKETLLDFISIQIKKKVGDHDTLVYIQDILHEEFGANYGAELN